MRFSFRITPAVIVVLLSTAANAGFVDERSARPPVAAAPASNAGPVAVSRRPARGALHVSAGMRAKGGAQWGNQVAQDGTDTDLVEAISRLTPAALRPVVIDAPQDLVNTLVSWPGQVSVEVALAMMAKKAGLVISYEDGQVVKVRPGEQSLAIASAATPQAGAAVADQKHRFRVELSDVRLANAMKRWADETGVRLRWDAERHVLIGAQEVIEASSAFDAIARVLATSGIANSDYPLEVCEYPNTPRLLRITRQGEQAKDCPN